jgi:tol-pal system protein YbgF
MATLGRHWTGASAVLAMSAILWGVTGSAGAAQPVTIDARDLMSRLQRMERDLRDLQAETFRRGPGDARQAVAPQAPPSSAPDLGPVMRRMDEVGDSISRLTGQMEELGHRVDLLAQKADRLQKELDYQNRQASQVPGDTLEPGDRRIGNDVASIAPDRAPPSSGILGQIPADTSLPAPGETRASPPPSAAGPRAEFDAAMNLLSRAQYDPASRAFREFVDSHPDDERASAALYWAGDIAYSAKKDYEEAARNFAELLKKYPMAPRAPEGMLKLALSLLELDQMKEGCAALAALPAKYPNASPAIALRARNERRDSMCR